MIWGAAIGAVAAEMIARGRLQQRLAPRQQAAPSQTRSSSRGTTPARSDYVIHTSTPTGRDDTYIRQAFQQPAYEPPESPSWNAHACSSRDSDSDAGRSSYSSHSSDHGSSGGYSSDHGSSSSSCSGSWGGD